MGDREGSAEKNMRRRKPSSDQCLPRKKQATEIKRKPEILKKVEFLSRLLPTKSFILASDSQKHNTNFGLHRSFFIFPGILDWECAEKKLQPNKIITLSILREYFVNKLGSHFSFLSIKQISVSTFSL